MSHNKKGLQKLKNLTNKYQKVTKVLLTLLIFLSISLISALLLYLFGVIYYDEGIQINQALFDSFKNTWYGYIIVVLAQIIITSLLSFSGVMLSSFMLYVLGRYGGYNLGKKIIGEEDCKKASDLLNNKGLIYFPMMMMFPVFPDDALVMVAGTLKMSLKWFIPSIVIGRGIGVVTIIFGLSLVPFDKFTSIWHWVGFILACAVLIVAVFFLANRFNKYLEKKNKKEEPVEKDEENPDEEVISSNETEFENCTKK